MFFLNFTVGEFLVLFAALAGLITALYLLDRSKKAKVVSTLRFWTSEAASTQRQSRKRMREPWSFLLQILSILLLLLAIGQLQWGSRERPSRNHVLLIDTSAWSSEIVKGETLMDVEKRTALRYLGRLPAADRVLLAGVDAFVTPATLLTSNRAELSKALEKLQSSYSALNIVRALSFARRAESLSSGADAEVVYIGPGRIQKAGSVLPTLRNLRTILIPADGENCGIRNVGLRRDDQNSSVWRAAVTIENYGMRARALRFTSGFPGRVVASRSLTIGPQEQTTVEYGFMQAKGGRLTTTIEPNDALRADNHVTLYVPGKDKTRLAVFTNRPQIIKPLIESDRNLEAIFSTPDQYNPHPAADAILLDGVSPAEQPQIPAFWIAPPRDSSPVPVEEVVSDATVTNWNNADALGLPWRGNHARIKSAEVLQATSDGDTVIANIAEGPVIVARRETDNHSRFVVLGFDPLQGELRFRATAPLLFANLLRWLCPESKQISGVNASFVGITTVPLVPGGQGNILSVTDENGTRIPFDVHDQLLEFSADRQSQVRIQFHGGARTVSLVLANIAEDFWIPPNGSLGGLPQLVVASPTDLDLWKWLAFAGGLGLLADWLLFGRKRRIGISPVPAQAQRQKRQEEKELVQR